tara:strand:+ start:115 stop:402 length:288 start_codon:yes stop_codon:yes gene_type:complete
MDDMQPTMIEFSNGDKIWFLNGKIHRTDGPAVVRTDGINIWYLNGDLHRTDGPSVDRPDAVTRFHLYGCAYTFDEWIGRSSLTDEEKVMMKLQYG